MTACGSFPACWSQARWSLPPWIPDESLTNRSSPVGSEFLWAALDCTSAFAVLPIPEGKAIVLGELCARIDGNLLPNEKCVVIGWPVQIDGRFGHKGEITRVTQTERDA